ncbi:MAG: hypothetical protein D6797_03720, partial [Bdellovibrio sp.]
MIKIPSLHHLKWISKEKPHSPLLIVTERKNLLPLKTLRKEAPHWKSFGNEVLEEVDGKTRPLYLVNLFLCPKESSPASLQPSPYALARDQVGACLSKIKKTTSHLSLCFYTKSQEVPLGAFVGMELACYGFKEQTALQVFLQNQSLL